jgi:hypothetical protein
LITVVTASSAVNLVVHVTKADTVHVAVIEVTALLAVTTSKTLPIVSLRAVLCCLLMP